MSTPLPFVGREAEAGVLLDAAPAAARGEGVVAFVAGEAGIGKTRLITEVAARFDVPVLWAPCAPTDASPAYWPWLQLLDQVADGRGEIRRHLAGQPRSDIPDEVRFELFDRMLAALCAGAEPAGLVLVLEDLHWADEPSLLLLRFVGRDPRARRLSIIGTYRDTDVAEPHPLLDCIADLAAGGVHLRLRGLGPDDVALLAQATASSSTVSPSTAALVHDRTGGNPLFVGELLRLLAADGSVEAALAGRARIPIPTTIRAVVAQRLRRLAPSTREVLHAAAVLGEVVDLELLGATADRSQHDALDAVHEATAAGLLEAVVEDRRWEFVHAVVREAVYEGLAPGERTLLHRRAARELELRGEDQLPRLADHLLRGAVGSDDRERATDCAVAVGVRAREVLAYEEAAEWFARAEDLLRSSRAADPRRIDVLLSLGEAASCAGDVERARSAYGNAARLASRLGSAEQLAVAALGIGGGTGGFEVTLLDQEQVELLEQALHAIGPGPSVLRTWLLARLSVALSFLDDGDRRRALSDEAVETGRAVGDPRALGYALASHCDVIAGPDHAEAREQQAAEVIRLGLAAGDRRLELLGRRLRLVALLELGRVADADAEIERFAHVADALRLPLYRWFVPLWRGMRALMRGELDEAARRRAEAERIGAEAGSDNAVVLTFTQWWVQQRYEGRFADAGRAMAELLEQHAPSTPPVTAGPRAVAALQAGDPGKARALLGEWRAAQTGAPLVQDSEWLPESVQLAEVAVAVDAVEEAELLHDRLRPYADRVCVEGIGAAVTGSVAWHLASLARFLGRPADADAHARAARLVHERIGLVGDPPPLAEPSDAPATSTPAPASETRGGTLRHEGDVWTISYAGRTVRLRDSKGLRDLAVLLGRPGEDVHSLDLVGGSDVGSEAGPPLDQQARRQYEQRIRDLQEDIDEATAANDPVRAERAEAELEALVQQLSEAFGLSGRSRATGSASERARSAVGQRLGAAIRNLEKAHPVLGRHLRNSVRTGTWCSYRPETAVPWEIHPDGVLPS